MGAAEATQSPKLRKPTGSDPNLPTARLHSYKHSLSLISYEAHSQPHLGGLKFKGLSWGWGRGFSEPPGLHRKAPVLLLLLSLLHLLPRAPVTSAAKAGY